MSSLVKILALTVRKELTLEFGQSYILEGENRVTIADFASIRAQTFGGALSDLVLKGVIPIVDDGFGGIDKYHNMSDFLTESRGSGYKIDQFLIRFANENSTFNEVSDIKGTVFGDQNLVFRGVLNAFNVVLNVENNMLIEYQIDFKIYPYTNSGKRISDAYWTTSTDPTENPLSSIF